MLIFYRQRSHSGTLSAVAVSIDYSDQGPSLANHVRLVWTTRLSADAPRTAILLNIMHRQSISPVGWERQLTTLARRSPDPAEGEGGPGAPLAQGEVAPMSGLRGPHCRGLGGTGRHHVKLPGCDPIEREGE